MSEIWKPVIDWPGYEVSNLGRVKTLRRNNNQILKQRFNRTGYVRQLLYNGSYSRPKMVHQMVMEAFIGPCPEGFEIDHVNNDVKDNRLTNLRYITKKENIRKASAKKIICESPTGKFYNFDTITEAAEIIGCTRQNISAVLNGKGNTAKNWKIKYE